MDKQTITGFNRELRSPARILADNAFSRAAGAPLVPGNSVRLLKDAGENYPAWLEAINSARRYIHFETYTLHDDHIGHQFGEAFADKARDGVQVRLLYDWFGDLGFTSRRFWRSMKQAGVELRCFNTPRLDSSFGWLSRDHRKLLSTDGRIAFISGLCIGRKWVGYPERGIEAWRDTGIELHGPAIWDAEQAFSQTWSSAGSPLPEDELPSRESLPRAGDVELRVIATVPNMAGLYRLDHLVAALARRSLWLTDAYFIGTTAYIQALRAAAVDGVDVRLLVPSASDVPLLNSLSMSGYRPLLEAGVRVFEWNGPMLHAKTAVADGRWSRVGSTNLNLASWIGNWELDVAVENEEFATEMEDMYLDDLEHATEIVLNAKKRIRPTVERLRRRRRAKGAKGSAGRAAAGAIGVGNAVGAAITNHRLLGTAEARIMASAALMLVCLAVIAVFWPRVISIPIALICGWVAVALLVRAYRIHRDGEKFTGYLSSNRDRQSQSVIGKEIVGRDKNH